MSLLNFPPEVTLQFIHKMNLVDRLNLSLAHTNLSPLCFDKSLQRKSTNTLTLNELRQLYEQSRTEKERDQCFKTNVLDRLLIKNFNEVVRLYMDPKNERFVANDKILHSLKGKFVLEGVEEKFSATFVENFLCLLERAEGTLLLAFVDVQRLEEKNARRCARILSRKMKRGQKVYYIDFRKTISWVNSCAVQIEWMDNPSKFTIYYKSFLFMDNTVRGHRLFTDKRNGVANVKELIDMINGESLIEAKQHLGSVLSLVEAAELSRRGRDIRCDDCGSEQYSMDGRMLLFIDEPTWSDCDGCEFK